MHILNATPLASARRLSWAPCKPGHCGEIERDARPLARQEDTGEQTLTELEFGVEGRDSAVISRSAPTEGCRAHCLSLSLNCTSIPLIPTRSARFTPYPYPYLNPENPRNRQLPRRLPSTIHHPTSRHPRTTPRTAPATAARPATPPVPTARVR
jgi:hypothetical protein